MEITPQQLTNLQISTIQQNKSQSSSSKNIGISSTIKCINNNKATYFCFNRRCNSKTPFSCSNEQCQCNDGHYLCSRVRINEVLKQINFKILQTQGIKSQIELIINDAINNLRDLKQKFASQVDTRIKYAQLSAVQKKFIDVCQGKQAYSDFGAKMLFQLWGIITSKTSQKQKADQETQQHLKRISQHSQSTIQKTVQQVKNLLKTYQSDNQKQEKRRLQILKIQRFKSRLDSIQNQILSYRSTILSSLEFVHRLVRYFPMNVKSIKQIFVASDYEFNINRYYELCGNLSSTIIICRTNGDKVIGAYSPLSFNPTKSKSGQYISDNSGESFIFSLSNNEIFKLINKSGAIYRYAAKDRIRVGSDEFTIGDKANVINNCYTNLNSYYCNSNYVNGEVNSYLRMNGNNSDQFKTKQWQVWRVQFESDQDY